MALRFLAAGGVFVGGGIAPKILSALRTGGFMEAFCDKGYHAPLLEKMESTPAFWKVGTRSIPSPVTEAFTAKVSMAI